MISIIGSGTLTPRSDALLDLVVDREPRPRGLRVKTTRRRWRLPATSFLTSTTPWPSWTPSISRRAWMWELRRLFARPDFDDAAADHPVPGAKRRRPVLVTDGDASRAVDDVREHLGERRRDGGRRGGGGARVPRRSRPARRVRGGRLRGRSTTGPRRPPLPRPADVRQPGERRGLPPTPLATLISLVPSPVPTSVACCPSAGEAHAR